MIICYLLDVLDNLGACNVLGVVFDSKLNWSSHVVHAIKKSNKALHAIRIIKQYFTADQIKLLLTSYFYSTLFYNSEIWLSANLCSESKSQLFSASGKALQTCFNIFNLLISFANLHIQFKQANPCQIGNYRLSLQLHKIFNDPDLIELVHLANQIISTSRQTHFETQKNQQI